LSLYAELKQRRIWRVIFACPGVIFVLQLQLQETPGLAARMRRRLNYSLLGLVVLAIPLGILVAYGAFGFRFAFGLFSEWVHGMGRVSTGLSQMLLLTAGGLVFGLLLKLLRWERFPGPANVIVAVHERNGRYNARDGIHSGTGELANRMRFPIWIQPAVSGALAGAVGLWAPEVLGLGDRTMQQVLDPQTAASVYGPGLLTVLCLAKLAPIATILIVFELTENYQAATAVVISVVAAISYPPIARRWMKFARTWGMFDIEAEIHEYAAKMHMLD
jgi:H+/Cl- antiporter ClcA